MEGARSDRTATTAQKGKAMTENNTPSIIEAITPEDLTAHRAELVRQRDEAYTIYLQTPRPDDQPHLERSTQLRALINAWDAMSDHERAEAVRDARTAPEVEAEPAEPALPELLEAIASKPYTDSADRPVILSAVAKLIELELGNEQKAEAMSALESTIRTQGDRIRELTYAQISGDDHRLADFWQTAGELAESAGYCDQYDHLCEQLGGVPRRAEFTVHHAISVTVQVSGYTSQTASPNTDGDEFSDYTDLMDTSDLRDAILQAVRSGDYEIEEEEIQEWERD